MDLKTSCAFTGHRPQRFAFGFDENDRRCRKLKAVLKKQIESLVADGVTKFYTGMALGVDQWAASIVLDIRKRNPAVRLVAVLPFEGQADKWNEEHRERYFSTLAACDDVVTLQAKYSPSCMLARNKYLVDHADILLAVYDGGDSGGTSFTVNYGKEKQRRIIIIDPDSLSMT